MASMRRLVLTPSVGGILKIISSFSESEFQTLASELGDTSAFDIDRARCERVGEAIGADADTAGHVIQLCGYLYGQLQSRGITPPEMSEVIGNLIDVYAVFDSPEERDALVRRLCVILGHRQSADNFRKAQRLRVGFHRNAISFSSLVDLRPDFSDDKKYIQRLIPVAQLRISTDADVPEFKEIVVQLDERSLARLKDAIQEMDEKFSTLHSGLLNITVTKW